VDRTAAAPGAKFANSAPSIAILPARQKCRIKLHPQLKLIICLSFVLFVLKSNCMARIHHLFCAPPHGLLLVVDLKRWRYAVSKMN